MANETTVETLEQFSERMSHVEKTWEHQVGPRYAGNSRAQFVFEGQYCYLESTGFVSYNKLPIPNVAKALLMTINTPSDYWWTDYMVFGKTRADEVAKAYNATLWEAPYAKVPNKWFHLQFQTFEDLMRFVYDRHIGVFEATWGQEKMVYENCF
jgi:hypothetical protein